MNRTNFLFAGILACAVILCSAVGSDAVTKRIYHVGNSLTDQVKYGNFQSIAESRGHTHIWGRHMIPGAPLGWIWEHPADGFQVPAGGYRVALADYDWDALVLQPTQWGCRTEADYANRFAGLAMRRNPNTTVYVHMTWPLFDTVPFGGFEHQWLSDSTAANRSRAYFEFVADSVAATFGAGRVCMVPNGEVMYSIYQKISAGQFPLLSSIWQMYADGVHLNDTGSYLVMITHYAVIYQDDPRGLSTGGLNLSQELANAIQQVVHDVVLAYPRSGVRSLGPYAVSGVRVDPAALETSTGRHAHAAATVMPSNATNPRVTWSSSASGTASVDSTGLVTAVAAGNASIVATTVDGSFRDTCLVTVVASGTAVDSVKIIPDTATLLVSGTRTLAATVYPAGATNKAVLWRALDTSVASVDGAGLVTAKKKGKTLVVVSTVNGNAMDSAQVWVIVPNNPPVPVMHINPSTGYVGATFRFDGGRSYDNDPGDFVLGYDWDFGDSSPIEQVLNTRHVYAATGRYTVRLRAMDGNGTRSDWVSTPVTVRARDAGLMLYDGFESNAGTIDGAMSGYGWGANSWWGNDSNIVATATPLTYGNLEVRGAYLRSSVQASRNVNGGDFPGYVDQGYLGKADTGLWVSLLIRKDMNTDRSASIEFHPSGYDCCQAGHWEIGYFGTASNTGTTRYWGVRFDTTVHKSPATVAVGQTNLLVAHLRWQTDGIDVALYVNPAQIGGAAPAEPTCTVHGNKRYNFQNISLHTEWPFVGEASFDELRIGTSFAAVTAVAAIVGTQAQFAPHVSQDVRPADLSALIRRGVVRGNIRITGLDGRVVWVSRSQNDGVVQIPQLKPGVVVVTMKDGDRVTAQKVLVK